MSDDKSNREAQDHKDDISVFTCPICDCCVSFLFEDTVACNNCEIIWVFIDDEPISKVKKIYDEFLEGSTWTIHFMKGLMPDDDEKLRSKMKAVQKLTFIDQRYYNLPSTLR